MQALELIARGRLRLQEAGRTQLTQEVDGRAEAARREGVLGAEVIGERSLAVHHERLGGGGARLAQTAPSPTPPGTGSQPTACAASLNAAPDSTPASRRAA